MALKLIVESMRVHSNVFVSEGTRPQVYTAIHYDREYKKGTLAYHMNIKDTHITRGPAVIFLICSACLLTAATAAAAWRAVGHAVNILTVPAFQTRIVEDYRPPKVVEPSDTIIKKVNVKNTGTVDAVVRVKIEKAFGRKDKEEEFTIDQSIDPDLIELHLDQTGAWKKSEDGYYYYRDVLKPSQTTKVPLMDAFTLSPLMPNEGKGCEGRILVMMESIQAEGKASSVWGMTEEELGIQYESLLQENKTAVVFKGRAGGFSFDPKSTDLFASFKDLLPGCSRVQIVEITNADSDPVRLTLHAESAGQGALTPEELALVNRFLTEYARIEIREGEEILYQGPVDGNLSHQEGASMCSPLPLGRFSPGQTKDLSIALRVSPEMDSSYMPLVGKVHWVFQANDVWSEYPYTGDNTGIWLWVILLAAGLAGIMTVIRVRQRRNGQKISPVQHPKQ